MTVRMRSKQRRERESDQRASKSRIEISAHVDFHLEVGEGSWADRPRKLFVGIVVFLLSVFVLVRLTLSSTDACTVLNFLQLLTG